MQYDVIGCDKNWVLHLQHNIAHTTTNPKKNSSQSILQKSKRNDLTRGRTWNLLISEFSGLTPGNRSQAPCHWAIRPMNRMIDERSTI
jgi:hypothetical protein